MQRSEIRIRLLKSRGKHVGWWSVAIPNNCKFAKMMGEAYGLWLIIRQNNVFRALNPIELVGRNSGAYSANSSMLVGAIRFAIALYAVKFSGQTCVLRRK
jgi:hypothetical protein